MPQPTINQQRVTEIVNDTLIQLRETKLDNDDARDFLAKKISDSISKEFVFLNIESIAEIAKKATEEEQP